MHVAGVCDSTGRVLGLMPHPERHIDPTQHPRWTRGEAGPVGDGLQVFLTRCNTSPERPRRDYATNFSNSLKAGHFRETLRRSRCLAILSLWTA